MNVDLYQTPGGDYHYQIYEPGQKNARKVPTACGLDLTTLQSGAWFNVGDRRGRVHYDRACAVCRAALVV
jgi:hypothetical protein